MKHLYIDTFLIKSNNYNPKFFTIEKKETEERYLQSYETLALNISAWGQARLHAYRTLCGPPPQDELVWQYGSLHLCSGAHEGKELPKKARQDEPICVGNVDDYWATSNEIRGGWPSWCYIRRIIVRCQTCTRWSP